MTDQMTLWGEGWKRPPLDRELTYLEEDHEAHMIQASDFYNWAITMAACGHDPCTPKEPMRLPLGSDWAEVQEQSHNQSRRRRRRKVAE
jgi:hypothetical protein